MQDDTQLLEEYIRDRSEPAFGELVARHIDLVYAAALRITGGDTHLAEDVTQTVFADLALKAANLPNAVLLPGWLYRHSSFTAAKAVRTERRRKTRDHIAMEMKFLNEPTGPSWELIAPHLDEALNHLKASDREVIVLRFLKRKDLRSVGTLLGITEDAAQKRVSRALEKLREVLGRHGIGFTTLALASALETGAVSAAPAGLAIGVTAGALKAVSGAGAAVTFFEFMASTKLKAGILSAIALAGLIAPLALQQQAQAKIRGQEISIQDKTDQLTQLEITRNSTLIQQQPRPRTTEGLSELLRLRGEIGRLREQLQERSAEPSKSRSEMLTSMAKLYSERLNTLKQLLETNPSEKIPELSFVTENDWLFLTSKQFMPDSEDGYLQAMSYARQLGEQNFVRSWLAPALKQFSEINGGRFPQEVVQLKAYSKTTVDEAVLQRWHVLPADKLDKSIRGNLQEGEDWVVTQKAPVNRELDQRMLLTLKKGHSFASAPPEQWTVVP